MGWLLENEKDPVLGEQLRDILLGLSLIPYNSVAGWYRWNDGEDPSLGIPYGQDCVGKLQILVDQLHSCNPQFEVSYFRSRCKIAGTQSNVDHYIAMIDGYIVDPFALQIDPIHIQDLALEGSIHTQGAVRRNGFLAELLTEEELRTTLTLLPRNATARSLITNTYDFTQPHNDPPQERDYVNFTVPYEAMYLLDDYSPYKFRMKRRRGREEIVTVTYPDNIYREDKEIEEALHSKYQITFEDLRDYFIYSEEIKKQIIYWYERGYY